MKKVLIVLAVLAVLGLGTCVVGAYLVKDAVVDAFTPPDDTHAIKPDEADIKFHFKQIKTDSFGDLVAVFTIENKSKYNVISIRGTLYGYDKDNKQILDQSYSSINLPAISHRGKSDQIEMGFDIKKEVVKMEFIPDEYDVSEK